MKANHPFFPPLPFEINLRFELTGSKNNKSKFDYRIRNTRSSIRFDYQANHKSISIRAAICRSRYREMCLFLSVSTNIENVEKKLIVIDKSLLMNESIHP